MKTEIIEENIQIIKKNNGSVGNCEICCLNGVCLDSGIDCFNGDYFILKDNDFIRYKFEVVNGDDS